MIPEGLKYTKEHEWIKMAGDEATIGITAHAQSELGDITFVDLPEMGAVAERGGIVATIESVKAASEVYSPLAGKVTEVNELLNEAPEKINSSPYDKGWICKITVSDDEGMDKLMDKAEYEDFLKKS